MFLLMGHQTVPMSSWPRWLVLCQSDCAQSAVPTYPCQPMPTCLCQLSHPCQVIHADPIMPIRPCWPGHAHPTAPTLCPRICTRLSTPTWLWWVVLDPSKWPWATLPCIFYYISSQLLEVFTASAGQIYFSLVTVQGLQKIQMLLWTKTATPSEALKSLFSLFP